MGFGKILRAKRMEHHLSQEALAEALGISLKSISRWEREQSIPQMHYRLQLSRFFGVKPEELFEPLESQISSPVWTVPFPRNPNFSGREEILRTLHTLLTVERPVALTQASALSGLGGIGKTQVAVEYAYRYGQEYDAVLWLAAETAESVMASMQKISDQLQLPEHQAVEQSQMVTAVQNWLATHPGWLLIVDNAEDLDLLQQVLPPVRPGALLFTTRRRALGYLATSLEVPAMSVQEGVALLLRRAGLLGFQTQSGELSETLPDTFLSSATELVMLLEGLPLALDQAGSYIEESGCSVSDYVHRYHDQRKMVLAHRGIHGGAHPASVNTTLRLSVEQAELANPAAADLLRVCAFLHPEAIPEEMFGAGASCLGSVLGPVVGDRYQFDLVMAALRNVSLVTRHPETRTLSIHRLVQAVLQDQMGPAEVRQWSRVVVCMVNRAFPGGSFDAWAQCERCLAQALACVPLIERAGNDLPEAGELLYKAGSYLLERGRFGEAEPLLEQAVVLGKYVYGPDHSALAQRLVKQAELLWQQGRYDSAEVLLHRALVIYESHMGPVHPQIAETLNNLAIIYCHQDKDEQAEPLLQRALAINEQQIEPEHTEMALTLNNLATVYRRQGKYEQAESLFQRVLAIYERQVGPQHPDTALPLNNLALLYRHQGKYEQAERLFLRAVSIYEQFLGPEHPDTAHILGNLALVYQPQGKYEQAESLLEQVLHIRERQLGVGHPKTVLSLNNLVLVYEKQEKYEQAEMLFQRVLRDQEQRLGPEHPETMKLHNDYHHLLERGRAARERSENPQGPIHPSQTSNHQRTDIPNISLKAAQATCQQMPDPFQEFLTTCCELHPHAWSRASELWDAYKHWAEKKQEHFLLSRREFTDQLKAHGCRPHRTNTARIWRGIAIVENPGMNGTGLATNP